MGTSADGFYYEAFGTNPYENLALEQVLMEARKGREAFLYLWQNGHSIIIGRNQDAYAECRVKEFLASGGCIARRLTGGGAVYHDLGNLNFTFIMPVEDFDIPRQMGVVCRALEAVGIKGASPSGRNDLLWERRKCSGNAFQMTKTAGCHHGTLLMRTNTEPMLRYLTAARSKLLKHGVQSVASRVVNLCDIVPELTAEALKEALREAFRQEYGSLRPGQLKEEQWQLLRRKAEHLQSPEWLYPSLPGVTETLRASFPWGEVCMELQVEDGVIRSASIRTDALDADRIDAICAKLQGLKRGEASSALLAGIPAKNAAQPEMLEDIAAVLQTSETVKQAQT